MSTDEPAAGNRPNIVLICVDQWRGDALSSAGHPVVSTPFLDQLALDGTRFSCAYSATPSCIPARAALLTGMAAKHHGRVGYEDGVAWDYPVTLAGELTRNGYQSRAVGKMHVYPERSQLGFQEVVLHDGFLHFARKNAPSLEAVDDYVPWLRRELGREADYFDHGVNCNSYVARPWDKPEYVHPTNFVVTQGIEFLRRRDPRKPFFLHLSFHRPHPPYDPPAWAFEQYLDARMPEVPVGDWVSLFEGLEDPLRPDCFRGVIKPELLRRARAGYYGSMTHIDQQINRFLESLDDHDAASDTWVFFVSDHGELMGDHHLFRKGLPYEGSAHVPLIVRGPAGSMCRTGGVIANPVELRDLMPTILDCAGVNIPDTVDGMSLRPFFRGEEPKWRPYIHGEHTWQGGSAQWITDGREKYIWFSSDGIEQFFDLEQDPCELHDASGDPACREHIAERRSALIRELEGREEGYSDGERLICGRPARPCLSILDSAGS